ncbi:hypothetical protein D3C75_1181020 [compost metagenome]
MKPDRLHQLIADREYRIQRGHRFLKNHGDLTAANFPQLIFTLLTQVFAVKTYFTLFDETGLAQQSHDRERSDTFTASGFSNNA